MGFVVFVIIVIIAWAIYDKFFGGIAQLERGLNNTRKELFLSVRNSIDQAKNKYKNITNMEQRNYIDSEFRKIEKNYKIFTTSKDSEERAWALDDIESALEMLSRKFG